MEVKINGKRVDVADSLCAERSCFILGVDKGTFVPGRGYTSYHKEQRWVCQRRMLHGCPTWHVCAHCHYALSEDALCRCSKSREARKEIMIAWLFNLFKRKPKPQAKFQRVAMKTQPRPYTSAAHPLARPANPNATVRVVLPDEVARRKREREAQEEIERRRRRQEDDNSSDIHYPSSDRSFLDGDDTRKIVGAAGLGFVAGGGAFGGGGAGSNYEDDKPHHHSPSCDHSHDSSPSSDSGSSDCGSSSDGGGCSSD